MKMREVVIFDSSSRHTDRYPRLFRAVILGRYGLGRAYGVWETIGKAYRIYWRC